MKAPRKVKKLQRKLTLLMIEKKRLKKIHLNLCDRIIGMAAKGEITYDEAVGFESSFYDIFADLSKVYSKIHHVLNSKRFKKYCRMLRNEYDYYERNCD